MAFDKNRFCGVIVPIVNPCWEDDSLDRETLQANVDRLLAADITGLYINGGTGDAANLTQQERLEIASLVVPQVRAANKTAIVHVGQTSQRQAVALAEQAVQLEADAVASIPPRKAWPQIIDYYKALTQTGANVIVYYIPGVTGIAADMTQLRMLLEIPGVIGIKMSDWNIFLLHCITLEYPEKVVYSGFDEMLVPGLLYGADGCIGTWANLLPDVYATVFRGVRAGNADAVRGIMNEFTRFLAEGWSFGILDAFEELMYARGYASRCFRRPGTWNPGKVDGAALVRMLEQLEKVEKMARLAQV